MNNNDEFKFDDNNDNFQDDGFKTEESNQDLENWLESINNES